MLEQWSYSKGFSIQRTAWRTWAAHKLREKVGVHSLPTMVLSGQRPHIGGPKHYQATAAYLGVHRLRAQ